MSQIDLSNLSKAELRELMRKGKQRLERLGDKAEKVELKSSDPRVAAIADQIRSLSEETGMRRREVFAVLAGSMRMPVGGSQSKS